MKTTILIASAALLCGTNAAMAQNDEPKFKINPTGRILLDGAIYATPQKPQFKDGFAIPDVRLGAKMQYGKWKAKIDVGFAYNKVGLKDGSLNTTSTTSIFCAPARSSTNTASRARQAHP